MKKFINTSYDKNHLFECKNWSGKCVMKSISRHNLFSKEIIILMEIWHDIHKPLIFRVLHAKVSFWVVSSMSMNILITQVFGIIDFVLALNHSYFSHFFDNNTNFMVHDRYLIVCTNFKDFSEGEFPWLQLLLYIKKKRHEKQ